MRPTGPVPLRGSRGRPPVRTLLAAVAVLVLAGWVGGVLPGGTTPAPLHGLLAPADGRADRPTPTAAAGAPLGRPAPVPPGGGSHAFSMVQVDGVSPVTWDPCRPVHLVVNDRFRPPGAHDLVGAAVDELRRATGLQLVVEGPTDEAPAAGERPSVQRERYGDRWAPVLVAWSDPEEHPPLAGDVAGIGGSVAHQVGGGPFTYVTGSMVLDGPQLLQIGRRPGGYRHARAVVLHELAHVVGLGHVDDPTHLMHPESSAASAFHRGDLVGLAALGRGECIPAL